MASSCKEGYYFCNSSQKCKRIPKGHKVQSDGELVREYVSDWRSDLQELAPSQQGLSTLKDRQKIQQGFDDRPLFMPKTTTTTKNGKTSTSSTMVSREAETRKAIDNIPKIHGVKIETDSDGHVPNAGKFAADISTQQLNKPFVSKVGNMSLGKNNFNQVKKYASDGGLERDVNSANAGSRQFRYNVKADEINQATQGARTKANNNKGRFRIGVTNNEELQGGISVEPYTKDTKFLEIETVDIIKPKALNATVSASYEADLENMIIEILEEDINDLHNNGFSYEEIAEFYDVKEELLNEGLVSGAIAGAKIIAKFAPKIAKFATKRGIKDRKILTKFVKNPKNWQRANTDIQKVIDAPKNTLNLGKSFRQFADKGYKALKGGAQKLIEPLKKKGEGDIAKWKKTQEVIKRANRLAKSKAEKAGQIVDVAPTTTNLPSAKTSLPLPKKVTKGMTPAEIRHQGMNALANLQGKTEKTKKAAELTKRMSRAVEVSRKPGTYSRKVDDALKLSNPNSIVKSGSSAVTNTKPSGSGLLNRIKNLLTGSKPPKQITGSKPSKNQIPDPWDNTTKLTTISKKSNLRGLKTAALTTGLAAGGLTSSRIKDKITTVGADEKTETPSITPDTKKVESGTRGVENKTIKNTEKKIVNPKKNEVVTKTTTKKTSTTPKGRTKWVGANTTWTDRHGNVIAPKAKENKKYKYGRTGSHLTPLEQEAAN